MLSGYLIGRSYQSAGELQNAEKAYIQAITTHPKHQTSVLSKWELAEIYRIRKDTVKRVKIWEDLTYKTKRTKENNYQTTHASIYLGQHHFYMGDFQNAFKAFETTYKGKSLISQLYRYASSPISSLTGSQEKSATGTKLADELIAYILEQIPQDFTKDANISLTRDYYYTIAAIHGNARRDNEGLAA